MGEMYQQFTNSYIFRPSYSTPCTFHLIVASFIRSVEKSLTLSLSRPRLVRWPIAK